jgi:hypothetical protein
MIQEGLRVAVPLKDKTLGVVAVEVQLVLQSPGVFSAHQFRAFRGETLKLVELAIMDFEFRPENSHAGKKSSEVRDLSR